MFSGQGLRNLIILWHVNTPSGFLATLVVWLWEDRVCLDLIDMKFCSNIHGHQRMNTLDFIPWSSDIFSSSTIKKLAFGVSGDMSKELEDELL